VALTWADLGLPATADAAARKARLRTLTLRFHPDKFAQAWGGRLPPAEATPVAPAPAPASKSARGGRAPGTGGGTGGSAGSSDGGLGGERSRVLARVNAVAQALNQLRATLK